MIVSVYVYPRALRIAVSSSLTSGSLNERERSVEEGNRVDGEEGEL